jgi:RHS repeat-associated protein
MRYYPYGQTCSGTMATDRLYTGQRWEAGIGLYDYNARYYDPALGRFVQADTVVPKPGNPQSFNRYAYCIGNPLRYTDPSGHFTRDAMLEYLKGAYPETWRDVWSRWLQDEAWMSMMYKAQGGDITFTMGGEVNAFRFIGYGHLKLEGIAQVTRPTGGESVGHVSLENVRSGALGSRVTNLLHSTRNGYEVIKTSPYDLGGYTLQLTRHEFVDDFGKAYTNKVVRDATIIGTSYLTGYIVGAWIAGLIAKFPAVGAVINKAAASRVGKVVGTATGIATDSFVDMIVPCAGCSVGEEAVFIQLALTPNSPGYARASVQGGSVHTHAQWFGSDN